MTDEPDPAETPSRQPAMVAEEFAADLSSSAIADIGPAPKPLGGNAPPPEKIARPSPRSDRELKKAAKTAAKKQKKRDALEAAKPVVRLKDHELRERLHFNSPGLAEEIHAIALRQNAVEDMRESRLDAKAQGLLGTAGLSLTVAFTFGGLLLQHPEYLEPLGEWPSRAVLMLYALALLFGLFASIMAVRALYVTDGYRCTSEKAVFDEAQLKSIENEAWDDDAKAKSIYRRYITIQHWTNWQETFAFHERKADWIKKGQGLFLLFLCTLILIGGAVTYSAFSQHENPQAGKAQATQ